MSLLDTGVINTNDGPQVYLLAVSVSGEEVEIYLSEKELLELLSELRKRK